MAPIRTSTISNPRTCPHLTAYKKLHGSSAYNSLQTILRTMPNGRTTLCRLQSLLPRCHSCSIYNSRLYLCLICSSVLCPADARAHPALLPGHEISVDLDRSELFCCVCADQVYDPEFDSTIVSKQFMGTVSAEDARAKSRTRKRRPPLDYRGHTELMLNVCWETENSSCYPSGLRGLSNLGNTCFMNSVLQVLLHTPPLRNYFLNDKHNREACHLKRRRRKGAVVAGEMSCLVCDMEGVFTAVFSGEWTPYNPAPFLYSWWQHLSNLASYEQQDAHEFFISMLDRIHEKEQSGTRNKGIGDCHCIAHRVFFGILRSDVTCTVCGFTSTTYDPCIDVSLDLEPYDCTTSASRSFKANDNSKISTLMGCLDHFTRAEKLGSDEKLYCEHCEVRQDSVKQMSIRRLPLVLCFHIKRFEHSMIRRTTKKIDQYLQFPFSLDMTPYLSSSVIRSRFGNRIFAFEGDKSDDSSSEFEVFAMVTHSGGMESGHYVTYLRLRNQWYKCDDAWITQVSEGVVRAAQCYMIYYLQKVLYHRASEDIDCLPVSPREWNN